MVQGFSSPAQVAVTCTARRHKGTSARHAADGPVPRGRGSPIFLFLRRIRALKLGPGYALVLTVPIALALWLAITFMVNLGRI